MARFSWQKLDNGSWGVKVSADLGQATRFAGQEVTVAKRSGEQSRVNLGGLVTSWNGGRAALYAVTREGRGREGGSGARDYRGRDEEVGSRHQGRCTCEATDGEDCPIHNPQYAQGVADGERYQAEKRIYGPALADQFAAQDEWNRYWKAGEDY